ncbi:MAG: tetratricopeptide repeat protein [Bacteroidales bacterium]|jgi:tetratricopeptide (TPR) repeat protein|nr:tetratricopeptide repeat protein [Bacteroidales bacterium]
MKSKHLPLIIILSLCFLQYVNTLTLDYAIDDRAVIHQNDFTIKGFAGIKDILTHDSFSAFFNDSTNLVAGGRYRPLSQITYVFEYEIFGGSIKDKVIFHSEGENEDLFMSTHLPIVSHSVNLLLYLLLIFLVYNVVCKLFSKYDSGKWYLSFTFLATLLFALHPIHTEVVANIKGRDELMTMLGGMLAVWASLQYLEKSNWLYLIISFVAILLGLFSKENAITFIGIIPLTLYFSNIKKKKSDWIMTILPAILASIIFIMARTHALGGFMPATESKILLNNPFMDTTTAQRIATVIFTWGIYLKLLIFPHPLCSDYYPKQIAITDFSDPIVILLLLFFIFIVHYAIKNLKRKHILSYAILFFIITFSIVSNLFISIGTFLNERFVFVSSFGFTLMMAYYINLLPKIKKINTLKVALLVIICLFYLGKGISRNFDWKNDLTIYTTDVKNAPNSIKSNVSAGVQLIEKYKKGGKEKDFKAGIKYLEKAIRLDPTYLPGYLVLGDAHYHKKNYAIALSYYSRALAMNPNDEQVQKNIVAAQSMPHISSSDSLIATGNAMEALLQLKNSLAHGEAPTAAYYGSLGRVFGMGFNLFDSAEYYLRKALTLDPSYLPALKNMGTLNAITKQYDSALYYFNLALKYEPNDQNIKNHIDSVKKEMQK